MEENKIVACADWVMAKLSGAAAWSDPRRFVDDGEQRVAAGPATAMNRRRLTIYYSGRVQGVGFRYTTKSLALGYDVTGIVRNLADGRVELVVEGDRAELESYRRAIQDSEAGSFVRNEDARWSDATGEFRGFEIVR